MLDLDVHTLERHELHPRHLRARHVHSGALILNATCKGGGALEVEIQLDHLVPGHVRLVVDGGGDAHL